MRSGNLTDFWCTIGGCTKSKHTSQVLVQGPSWPDRSLSRNKPYDSCITSLIIDLAVHREVLLLALLLSILVLRHRTPSYPRAL